MLVRLATLAAVAVPSAAWAQTPAAAPATPGSPKLIATWEGPYVTEGPSGTMTVVVAKDGAAWKVTTTLGGDAPPPAGEQKDIKADGGTLTWTQNFGDYEVHFTAKLAPDGAKLDGTLEAFQGGASVGGGTFNLTKKA
jgi:hypothetical protein